MIQSLPTIKDAVRSIRAGELQPRELVEYCLARIRELDERIHAWVWVDEVGAKEQAQQLSAALRDGRDPGPLAGVPLGVKDIVDVAGWPTQAGSPLRENHVATQDAPLVQRLRAAGAIILGKTVTTEFACFDPPATRNPWNLDHTPGGSSSGSAAAVALEMCMSAVGTQTGGSIIRPASYCGVVGFKPSFGQISLDGVVPVSHHLDHAGPIARCVQDARAIYETLRNPRGRSPSDTVQPSLAVIKQFFFDEASREIRAAFQAALEKLQNIDERPLELRLPDSFAGVQRCQQLIMAVDAAAYHGRNYIATPDAYGPKISSLIELGLSATAVDYASALVQQQRFQADIEHMFPPNCMAVMPATNTTAPAIDTTGDPKFQLPWSFAGIPSITIPAGIAPDGLPWGLQLVGPTGSEEQLLTAAQQCEERLDFKIRPSLSACSQNRLPPP